MRFPLGSMPLLALALALQMSGAVAANDTDEQTDAQATCQDCGKVSSGLFSPKGFLLFDFLASKPCYPPKRYYISAKSQKGLLLLHTMELLVKQMEQDNLKKQLSKTPEEVSADIKHALNRDKELIKKLRSNIELYARKIEEEEDKSAPWYVAIFKSPIWSTDRAQDFWSYLQKIQPNIKMGNNKTDDFAIICDHTQQVKR